MNAARKYSIAWKGLSEGEHTFDFEAGDDLFRLSKHRNQRRALRREGESFTGGTSASPRDFDPGQRSGGVRSLSGRLFRSDRLRRRIAGEILRRSPRIRRRYLVALTLGRFRGSDAIYLRKHRPFSALSAGAPRRGVRSGYVGTLPHRFRAGVRNDRERNATAGKRGLGLRTMDRTTVRHQTADGAGRKNKKH